MGESETERGALITTRRGDQYCWKSSSSISCLLIKLGEEEETGIEERQKKRERGLLIYSNL
jgi:hypothetical protein